jgi:hypothetical protein
LWCPGEGTVFFRIKQSGPRSYLDTPINRGSSARGHDLLC